MFLIMRNCWTLSLFFVLLSMPSRLIAVSLDSHTSRFWMQWKLRWGARGREDKFADYVKRFAVLSGNKPVYPILERVVKGVPGYDSKYKPTPEFETVLVEVVKLNESLLSEFFSPHLPRVSRLPPSSPSTSE